LEKQHLFTAAAVAKDRLEQYLSEKLKDAWDECTWEFYAYLLEQAQKHPINTSGYGPILYQKDHATAVNNRKLAYPDNFISDKNSKEKK
jgi:hypothetical protein